MVIQTVYQQTSLSTPISETCTWCVGLPCMWGSGPHMLGSQVSYIKKKRSGKEKQREEKREKKNTSAQISSTSRSHFICDPIKLKFGGEVQNLSSYNMNSEIRFWARELVLLPLNSNDIFLGIIYPIFLCFFYQERLDNPRLNVLLMYFEASIYYSR